MKMPKMRRPGRYEVSARDVDSGVRAYVYTLPAADGPVPEIRRVVIDAPEGRGLRMMDLAVLAALGMRLPDGLRPVPELSAAEPAAGSGPVPPVVAVEPVVADPQAELELGLAAEQVRAALQKAEPRKAPAKAAAVSKPRGARKGTRRGAYRRMPEPEVLVAEYQAAGGSPVAMAKAMNVPRHTVAGWVRRAKRIGIELTRKEG